MQKIPDRYEEPLTEERFAPREEQRRWEEEHIGAAALSFGAKDARARGQKQYDYVMEEDEVIQFVSATQIKGTVEQVRSPTVTSVSLFYTPNSPDSCHWLQMHFSQK